MAPSSCCPPAPPTRRIAAGRDEGGSSGWLALAALGAVLAAVAVRHGRLPEIRPAAAPPSEGFSAGRARAAVAELVACGPKYAGLPELEVCAVEKLRAHVENAIRGYEDRVQVGLQNASGHFYIDFLGGFTNVYRNITNLVARLRGRQNRGEGRGCALLVSAHFDSALGSPAASDDNAEIAIMVELLHILAREPPEVDIIFNFNGGEETIMQAAHGFVTSHSWATDACAVINLEGGIGSGGREILFQVGPNNRWLVEAYGRAVPRPHASSIFQAAFQLGIIPGDTDYRVYRDFGGLPGADFAITQNGWVYHTRNDDMQHMDFRSVQHYGDSVLAFARALCEDLDRGAQHRPEAQESAVFFDMFGTVFISYPENWARRMHFTGAAVALAWALLQWSPGRAAETLQVACWLCLCMLASMGCAVTSGALLAFSPRALIGHGHPEVTPLLFGSPAVMGFAWLLRCKRTGARSLQEEEELVAAASVVLAAAMCAAFSLNRNSIMMAYVPFAWAVCPVMADVASRACPARVRPGVAVVGHIVPWVLLAQIGAVLLEVFIPLTGRSGTVVPGDVVQAACYGLLLSLLQAMSARFFYHLSVKGLGMALRLALLLGILASACLFPYSGERVKRVFMQHTERVAVEWNLTASDVPLRRPVDSGIWTVAMDWNGVATLRDHAPWKLPDGSRAVDDSAGLYGEVPHYFPLRRFVRGGTWAPRSPPSLPSRLVLDVSRGRSLPDEGEQLLHFSVRGGPQIMAAIGPRAAVRRWSLGHLPGGFGAAGAAQRRPVPDSLAGLAGSAGGWELPPLRGDCDCIWLFFTEGGVDPTRGRGEAFNFSAVVLPGRLQLDLWAPHLRTVSPEVQEQLDLAPAWVDLHAWSAELQMHTVHT